MEIDIPRRGNGLPLLYKSDIEETAELYLGDFNSKILEEPMPTPIEEFLENYLHLEMDYADITPDVSVLGLTTFDNGILTVYYTENNRDKDIQVKKGTVIIDNLLLLDEREGRYRFTCGHEGGHWICHKEMFKSNENQFNILDMLNDKKAKSVKCLKRNFENYSFKIAADNILKEAGIDDNYIILGQDFETDEFAYEIPREISKVFNVSMQAASIRLNN